MLVLTRRLEEKVVLPGLGVSIQVLQVKQNQVKLGIKAPSDVKVLRDELCASGQQQASPLSHALANTLNKISLSLHLLEKHWQAGNLSDASQAITQVRNALEELERDNAPRKSPPPKKKPCTLVVEDDSNERQMLAGLLKMNGCDCPTVADGQEALDYLSQHDRPDFVLMDLLMPRLDGRHAMQKIRDNPHLRDVKIYAISKSRPEETGPGGFDAWFSKPLNVEKLLQAIQQNVPPQST